MHYPCPTAADLANIQALNAEYLKLAAERGDLPVLAGLGRLEVERLAAVPFLLFSIRFDDDALWQRMFEGKADLVDAATRRDTHWHSLIAGSLAFLWSTAQTNPYAVRLFTGTSAYWCRQLAARRLICITNRALNVGLEPSCRIDTTSREWRDIVRDSVSANQQRRDVTVLSLFQSLSLRHDRSTLLASAACRIPQREKTRHR